MFIGPHWKNILTNNSSDIYFGFIGMIPAIFEADLKTWKCVALLTFFTCLEKNQPVKAFNVRFRCLLRWMFLTVSGLIVMASSCVAVFVGDSDVLCLHCWRCLAQSSHAGVQCCIYFPCRVLLLHPHCSLIRTRTLNFTKPESNVDLKCFLLLSSPSRVCLPWYSFKYLWDDLCSWVSFFWVLRWNWSVSKLKVTKQIKICVS